MWHSAIIYNQSLSGLGNRWLLLEWPLTEAMFDGVLRANAMSPRAAKALIYGGQVLLLVAAAWVLGRRRRSDLAHGNSDRSYRVGLECSVVLLLMVLLSPMSSKPHFCTLLLPAFCVARLAVAQRDRLLGAVMLLAILTGGAAMRDLVGVRLASYALWSGAITGSTLLLLFGCGYALWRGWDSAAFQTTDQPVPEKGAPA